MQNFVPFSLLRGVVPQHPIAFEVESRKAYYILFCLQAAFYCTILLKGLMVSPSVLLIFLPIALIWLSGFALQYLNVHNIGQVFKAIALFTATLMTIGLLCGALAISDRPYADAMLNAWDKALFGIDWVAMVKWTNSNQSAALALNCAYVSLNWQPVLLFLALFCTKKSDVAWRSLAALSIAVAICVAIFPVMPAVGGYAYFNIVREEVPNVLVPVAWQATALHDLLRSGAIQEIGVDSMGGLITMPSFHASAAVILAWGFWHSSILRWPSLIVNFAMLLSTIPIGGHYIVDVLAGSAIAIFAIVCARGAAPRQYGVDRAELEPRREQMPALLIQP